MRKKKRYIYVLIIVFLFVVYVYRDTFVTAWKEVSKSAGVKTAYLEASASGAILPVFTDLQSENERLRQIISTLAFSRVNIEALQYENGELRKLLNAKDLKENSLLARVYQAYKTPIPKELPVFSTESKDLTGQLYAFDVSGFILGNIKKEGKYDYLLNLFSYPDNTLQGFLLFDKDAPSDKLSVDVLSVGSGTFEFFVNKEYPVKKGQILYFKTYPMAQVSEIMENPQSPFVKVWARLPFDLSLLDFVLIKGI